MSARTNRRRRKQAKQMNNHVAKLGRRVYRKKSASKQARQLRRVIEKQRLIAARKGNKGG